MSTAREPLGGTRGPSRSLRQVPPETRHNTPELLDSAADDGGARACGAVDTGGHEAAAAARREQSIPRQGLLKHLRSGSDRRLTLIACPAGFGKTSLLSAWYVAEAARGRVAWLTLDEGDNDPVVLWSHAIGALRRAPRRRQIGVSVLGGGTGN